MPYQIKKSKAGGYDVIGPNGKKAIGTTLKKAKAQVRLLNAREHGWKPK